MAAKVLSPGDVPPILERLAAGQSYREVSLERGVSRWAVADIAQGRAWRSIPGPRPAPDRCRPLRPPRGSKNGQAKLHERDIPKIRAARARGVTLVELGARYGVSSVAIRKAVIFETWRHVPPATDPERTP